MKNDRPTYEELLQRIGELETEVARLGTGEEERVEKAILESESRFQLMFDNTMNGIYMVELENRKTQMVNSTFCRMLGYSREDMRDIRVDDIHPADALPHVLKEFERLIRKEIPSACNIPVKRKDGTVFIADISTIPLTFNGKECLIGIFQDVTDRNWTEEALARSELIYRTTIDALDEIIHVVDSENRFTLQNRSFQTYCEKFYKYTDVLGRKVQEAFPFLSAEVMEEYRQVFLRGETLVTEETNLFGDREITTQTRKIPVVENGRVVRAVTVVRDVTQRRLWEQAMEESEERFRALFEGSLDAIFLMDPGTGVILDMNPSGEELLLRPREKILGLKHHRIHPPRLRKEAEQAFSQYVRDSEEFRFVELPVLRSDGTEVPVEILAQMLQIKGVPVIYGAYRDITKRKEAEEALRKSEQKYRALYENLRDASATVDLGGRFVEFNAVFGELFGYEPEEILRLKNRDITPKKWHPVEDTIIREQVMKRGYSDVYEKEFIRKDGSRCPVEMRTYLIRDENGFPRGMWAIIRDISGRKKMEKELMRVQTLESLGTLAGGIAHDFNNQLAAILTSISFATRYGELSEEVTEVLGDAEKVTMRARGLTYQLLSFAKGGEPVKKAVSIPRLVRETAEFALSGSNVKCSYRLPADLWTLDAEEGQIGQVLQNLIINADQAMPEGGKIHLRAENVRLGIGEIVNLASGAYVKISIEDTGHGIPRKQLPKIFDLFFTTKGRGRGMGLATAFMAVKRHNGHIQVESSPGQGTAFHIYLPSSGEKNPATKEQMEAALGGTGRLLLIDDEPIIRKSAGRVLERLGYQVALAGDGKEGLELYEKSKKAGQPFDLVIADLTIPGGMGGKEMIKILKKKHPDARVIVSSGYSEDPIMSEYWKHGIQAVVAKPYMIEKLAETVRKVLAGRDL